MAKYMFRANYSTGGASGLLKDGGTSRRNAIKKLATSVGGKLESFYFMFGEYDAVAVVDVPDNVSAAAAALMATASGAVEVVTTVLLTPAEIDEAVKKAPAYKSPGG